MASHEQNVCRFECQTGPLGARPTSGPHCISCELDRILVDPKAQGIFTIALSLEVARDGTVTAAEANGAPTPQIKARIEQQAQQRLFEPYTKDGARGESEAKHTDSGPCCTPTVASRSAWSMIADSRSRSASFRLKSASQYHHHRAVKRHSSRQRSVVDPSCHRPVISARIDRSFCERRA